ncbi:hypothetical protein KQJ29_37835, partial [Enterococcus sp. S181_ASV_20]|nr:hypothetical protein [Enterococcus sp. S181_ASV_20]
QEKNKQSLSLLQKPPNFLHRCNEKRIVPQKLAALLLAIPQRFDHPVQSRIANHLLRYILLND